ncbi:hypothetical protein [Streptomyces sp. NBC_01589]|uniref:hypothetical protein n=1 Tax=unclassified Streptomyces TaxID=2593676 RepID=UPI00386AD55B
MYENPTVRALAARLRSSAGSPSMVEQPRPAPLRHGRGRITRAGMAQAATLYGLLLLLTGPVAVSYAVNHARLSGWGAVGTTIAVLAGYTAVR